MFIKYVNLIFTIVTVTFPFWLFGQANATKINQQILKLSLSHWTICPFLGLIKMVYFYLLLMFARLVHLFFQVRKFKTVPRKYANKKLFQDFSNDLTVENFEKGGWILENNHVLSKICMLYPSTVDEMELVSSKKRGLAEHNSNIENKLATSSLTVNNINK